MPDERPVEYVKVKDLNPESKNVNTTVKLPVPSLRGSIVRLLSDSGRSKVPAPACIMRRLPLGANQ